LSLSENTIKYLPDCFKYLSKLEYLDLFQTQLDDIPEYFETFTKLTYLDVRGMNFTEKFQDHWQTVLPNTKIEFDSPCNCLEKN
jgi:Leucine-rich repeat (LRR) protein